MSGIKHMNWQDIPAKRKAEHEAYEYNRRKFLGFGDAANTWVSIYEIPPGKSAYPYHYHHKNEETFFILRGQGLLKTPEGDRTVSAGDLLFFPANSEGAHKLTNLSETEDLVYIDFDVVHDLDVAVYPETGKLGIWGKNINRIWRQQDDVDYYDGE